MEEEIAAREVAGCGVEALMDSWVFLPSFGWDNLAWQDQVTFGDVAVYFSQENWGSLMRFRGSCNMM
jgi:hypothetical protein